MQNRCFVSPFIGSFMQSKADKKLFQFIPNKEFIETGNLKYNNKTDLEGTEDQTDPNKSKS